MAILFKICDRSEWARAGISGIYEGSADDRRDGFIHLSGGSQLVETAAKHFAGQADLVLIAFEEDGLVGLKWEVSRGGQLFPHVHGTIPVGLALWAKPLPLEGGKHRFPEGVTS
jgi:uncharacterized protein (DUF952 family)